jgi:hypothetical protein
MKIPVFIFVLTFLLTLFYVYIFQKYEIVIKIQEAPTVANNKKKSDIAQIKDFKKSKMVFLCLEHFNPILSFLLYNQYYKVSIYHHLKMDNGQ